MATCYRNLNSYLLRTVRCFSGNKTLNYEFEAIGKILRCSKLDGVPSDCAVALKVTYIVQDLKSVH